MMRQENEPYRGVSKAWYLLGGAACGAVIALLYAPKSGVELREDIADWRRRNIQENGGIFAWMKSLFVRAEEEMPIKARGQGALHEPREFAGSRR